MKPLYDKWVKAAEDQIKAEAEEKEAAKKQEAGLEAPVFTLNDLEGKPLALTSLRGKYVILDFWGSWCVWCIRGIPNMKAYYAKYKDKLEILGVDCNDTEERWQAAVNEHQIPWLHVRCDEKAMRGVGEKYRISGFPTKVIIDPEGKVVKTVVGEDPAFYTFLDELLK
jgi:thiol-disulfide isomerase/thioredoxin